jgi:hypothetical protein
LTLLAHTELGSSDAVACFGPTHLVQNRSDSRRPVISVRSRGQNDAIAVPFVHSVIATEAGNGSDSMRTQVCVSCSTNVDRLYWPDLICFSTRARSMVLWRPLTALKR